MTVPSSEMNAMAGLSKPSVTTERTRGSSRRSTIAPVAVSTNLRVLDC
jgi:hypothetical protein